MHSAIGIEASDRSQLQAKDPAQHNLPTTLHALIRDRPRPLNLHKEYM
jgi:hypothetical protein